MTPHVFKEFYPILKNSGIRQTSFSARWLRFHTGCFGTARESSTPNTLAKETPAATNIFLQQGSLGKLKTTDMLESMAQISRVACTHLCSSSNHV